MAAQATRQRPVSAKKGPGPDHSSGAWIMEDDDAAKASPMTAEQARILKSLAVEGREPEAFSKRLSAEGAEIRIRVLRAKLAKDKDGKQHKPD